MATWSNPKIEATINGILRQGTVARMVITARRSQPVATIDLILANQRSDWTGLVSDNDTIAIQWGYTGFATNDPLSLAPIFDGYVVNYHEDDSVVIKGQDKGYLLTSDVDNKTFSRMAVSDVARALVQGLPFSDTDITEVADVIEVLAIQHETIAGAFQRLNRAAGLDYALYCTPDGVLHWGPEDTYQSESLSLSVYSEIISYKQMYGGQYEIMIQGKNIWHSEIVEVENWQHEKNLHYITGVKHMVGVDGKGTRTLLTTRQL